MYLSDSYTAIANLASNPALTMPWWIDRKGLPIGLQLIADHFREDLILLLGECQGHLGRWRPVGNYELTIVACTMWNWRLRVRCSVAVPLLWGASQYSVLPNLPWVGLGTLPLRNRTAVESMVFGQGWHLTAGLIQSASLLARTTIILIFPKPTRFHST